MVKQFYLTDTGLVRETNEDSVIINKNQSNEYLLAVADGMGGHTGGEIASSIAIKHLGGRFKNTGSIGNVDDAIAWLKEVVHEINLEIYKHTSSNPESEGMGTTLVCAIMTKDFLIFGNIGDSSGFILNQKNIYKITKDHTLVNLLLTTGELTKDEAKNHPKKNVLMRALGSTKSVEMDVFQVESSYDGILLCSDGVTNMLEEETLAKILSDDTSVEDKVKKIVQKSNNRGGSDNISVAYLERGDESA
jgi:serine/threonine protein phosphatase PrpC